MGKWGFLLVEHDLISFCVVILCIFVLLLVRLGGGLL